MSMQQASETAMEEACEEPHSASHGCKPTIADAAVGYSTFSGTSNILLSVLGAGQLSLPYAFGELGWVAGTCFLLLFALLGVHSLNTLAFHSLHRRSLSLSGSGNAGAARPLNQCPAAESVQPCSSYTELAVEFLGPRVKLLCDFLVAAYAWGGAVSFMLILKGELTYLLDFADSQASGVPDWLPLVILAACLIWPLSSRKSPGALRRVGPFGCMAAVFITFVVLACAPWSAEFASGDSSMMGMFHSCAGPAGPLGTSTAEPRLWPKSFFSAAAALPLLSFALNSSWAFVPILAGLRERSSVRVTAMIWTSSSIIALDYSLLAIAGYATFCDATSSNILRSLGTSLACSPGANLDWRCVVVVLARSALAVQLSLALPLRFFVARSVFVSEHCPPKQRWLLSGLLVASAASLAATPLPLAAAMGVTSSICASLIIYILPAIIDISAPVHEGRRIFRRVLSMLSLPVGASLLVVGTIANLMGVSQGA